MEVGDHVIDGADDDPDLAVVVHRPDATIADRTVTYDGEERTVAEDNPDSPADEPAVVVAFVDSGLDNSWPAWRAADPADLYDGTRATDVPLYTFPKSRLTALEEAEIVAHLDDPTVDMAALQDRLADAEWAVTMDDSVLVAEKLGERYRIHPTGDVDGEGKIREPVENIVQQYIE